MDAKQVDVMVADASHEVYVDSSAYCSISRA